MQVLVTESITGAARPATAQLEAAGHRVLRCHDNASTPFPCSGLTAECPLDTGTVDLVLAVRPHVQPRPAAGEVGVICGLRRRIPIAVAGQPVMNPFESLGAVTVGLDMIGDCERVAASRRPDHERVAAEVARDTLAVEGFGAEPFVVSVRRIDGRLRVQVLVPAVVPDDVRRLVAVRVVGRLRTYDTSAAGIDIGVGALEDREEPE